MDKGPLVDLGTVLQYTLRRGVLRERTMRYLWACFVEHGRIKLCVCVGSLPTRLSYAM